MDEHHLSLTSPGPSGVHHLERPLNISFEFPPQTMLASQQENMNFTTREAHAAGKDPMVRWYEVNDGPWHPPELTSGTGDGSGQSMIAGMRDGRFMVPNRSNIPSEIMPQSDSGYGSYHNQPSIANGSVCDDPFDPTPDTQSIMGGSMVDAQFSVHDAMSKNHIPMGGPCDSWSSPQIRVETLNRICEECGKPVRTKSEQKKHDQRHKKPFKCDVKGCTRTEGFSTTNDLDRHKRSVHPGAQTLGNRYVCQIGSCKNKDKIWPRADNFKAHLKRVHLKETVTEEDLDSCIYKPPASVDEPQDNPRQETISDYNGYSGLAPSQSNNWPPYIDAAQSINSLGHLGESQGESALALANSQRELGSIQISHSGPRQQLYQETAVSNAQPHSPMASFSPMNHNQLSREIEVSESGSSPTQEDSIQLSRDRSAETQVTGVNSSVYALSNDYGEYVSKNSPVTILNNRLVKADDAASDSVEPECTPASGTVPLKLDLSTLDLDDTREMRRLVEVLQSRGLLEQFGYKKEGSEAAELAKTETDATMNQSPCHPCPTCGKTFPRRCELKKHEKRHEKPYGCTMPDCDKRFGSKNDWKRHENTQHFMSEMWRCDEESCEKLCQRREMFKAHLEKDHQITEQNDLDAKLEKCRFGRNCEARFWCGFCQKMLEIKQKGHQAWAERFDHIDEHFSGRNDRTRKDPSEWKDFDFLTPSKDDFSEEDDSRPAPKSTKSQHSLGHSKSKRKRDDAANLGNSKKARTQDRGLSCHCGDLVTVSQLRCNFPCEHIPCANCQ
ncbi:hypothetical protein F5Y01DRAFT_305027 [Xylaria sp. FL0043]|nr:hypothetical protein F5Y01DRAFT_305027 [Xylaria sp. FL0043]